jgi:outer membrane protein OmpA-like peptidoglycan-associated protein
MTLRLALPLAVALALAACASRPVQQGPLPGSPVPAAPAKPAPLAAEQKWLSDWFSGTPVQIGAQDDGALRVAVPLRNSFDPGQAKVKPALGAVLDKVSTSLKRQPGAKVEVAAPADPSGTLAPERGDSLRDYLVAKGVRGSRITRASSSASLVELRLLPPPTAIERLDDSAISGSGTRAPVMPPARK